MLQEAVAEIADGVLDGLAETFADARAGIKGILMVAFDPAFGGGFVGERQARGMQQTVEDGKVGEEAVGEDAVEIELQVAQLDEARAIAQEAENAAIGDEAVELFVEIDELLNDWHARTCGRRRSRACGRGRRARGIRRSGRGPGRGWWRGARWRKACR